jgi:hypothetical protein
MACLAVRGIDLKFLGPALHTNNLHIKLYQSFVFSIWSIANSYILTRHFLRPISALPISERKIYQILNYNGKNKRFKAIVRNRSSNITNTRALYSCVFQSRCMFVVLVA